MSLDKAIEHGKEFRKPYRKSKAFDRSCRCGGSCPWCREDRRLQDLKLRARVPADKEDVEETLEELDEARWERFLQED
jgi:hypothetical protein